MGKRHTRNLVVPDRSAHERPLRDLDVNRVQEDQRICKTIETLSGSDLGVRGR